MNPNWNRYFQFEHSNNSESAMQNIGDYQVRLQDMANELLEKVAAWSGRNVSSRNAPGGKQVDDNGGVLNDDDGRDSVSKGCCESSRGRARTPHEKT
ncbi:hypothetical protein ACHAPX_010538 [Trichoderma viride]